MPIGFFTGRAKFFIFFIGYRWPGETLTLTLGGWIYRPTDSAEEVDDISVDGISFEYTLFYFIRNFKKLEGYISPTLRNWLVMNLRNLILGIDRMHNFRINPSPKVPKVI